MRRTRLLGALMLLMALTIKWSLGALAQADITEVTIAGIVYHDLNGNMVLEEGEPGTSGIALDFSDGNDQTITVVTDGDGAFRLQLGVGIWQVLVQPPTGFQISDETRLDLLIDGTVDSLDLDIPLMNDPEIESTSKDQELFEDPEATTGGDDQLQVDIDEDETANPEPDGSGSTGDLDMDIEDGFYILPESGGAIPAAWIGLLASVALLIASLFLMFLGRELRGEDDSSTMD